MKLYDTIAAIATPIGSGGVAIIRVSGDESEAIAQNIVVTKSKKNLTDLESHKLTLSDIYTGSKPPQIIDEALVVVMRAPNSYTGETVVEINCHGGFLAAGLILDELLLAGARLADAGEFTRRAFINGKTDLSGAEATMDIIDSHSSLGLQNAAKSLTGGVSKKIEALREKVIALTSHISATADYPEEINEIDPTELNLSVTEIQDGIESLLSGFNTGKILKDGIYTVIVGKPNVGKSSILNALVKAERAIVTDIPGTTRDIIEEYINIKGVALRLLDTAGIRNGADAVETIGIERAMENAKIADLCLFVIDSDSGITSEDIEISKKLQGKNTILILNKTDKSTINKSVASKALGIPEEFIIETSTPKTGCTTGINNLEDAILNKFITGKIEPGEVYICGERQKDSLLKAKASIERVLESSNLGMPFDILYIDLEDALSALGEIIGTTIQEEIIDQVFSRFCVGK
ncbi:MAG: tRNA uridine-5-carboxymethylaminomethyl(34) synthesis GTPase MnmE [Oscillospiraceae bacterium]